MKENLLIVWTNGDIEVANNFPLLYSSVILDRQYWKTAHLMLWGPSIFTRKRDFYSRKTKTYLKHRCNNECLYSLCRRLWCKS